MHPTRSCNSRHSHTRCRLPSLLACLAVLTLLSSASIDAGAQAAAAGARYERVVPSSDGIGKRYMGREIAGVMGWEGAQWLERESRAREERPELLLRELALAPGMTLADVGAGTGYYTWQLAKQVGPSGRVYAVDVQPEMIRLLDSQMAKRSRLGSGWRPPDAGMSASWAVNTVPEAPGAPCFALRFSLRSAYTAPGIWACAYCCAPALDCIRSKLQSNTISGAPLAIRVCSSVAEIRVV